MTRASRGMPHVVYVAWGFPPARSGGVYRALATANAFAASGWRVTVLTADRDLWFTHTGADITMESSIDPRITVRRLPFSWPANETDLRRWSWGRVLFPRLWWRWRKRRDLAVFPEPAYGPWRTTLERAIEQVHAVDPVDLTVATVNPYVDAAPALALWRSAAVPYVVDYRDAWSLDVFSGATVHPPESAVGRIESELLADAREIWFVNEPIRQWHQHRYPGAAGRMHVVANGYDLSPTFPPAAGRSQLTFGYVGTVSAKVPLGEFVRGWQRAWETGALGPGARAVVRGYLGYYQVPDARMSAVVDAAAEAGVSYEGPVGKHEIAEVYQQFDVLLLILGSGRYVTSGKVYEYMSTGLPIVSVHDPRNAASEVLSAYPHHVAARSLSAQDIATALGQAATLSRSLTATDVLAARRWASRFQRSAQLTPRLEALHP